MIMSRDVLLVLTTDENLIDINGRQISNTGIFEATDFLPDKNPSNGFIGCLWGKSANDQWLSDDDNTLWLVVKSKLDRDMVELDSTHNLMKFKQGEVIHVGCPLSCYRVIAEEIGKEPCQYDETCRRVQLWDTLGVIVDNDDVNDHAITRSQRSSAITHMPGTHALAIGPHSCALTFEDSAHAMTTEKHGHAVAINDNAHAMSLGHLSRARSCGQDSVSVAMRDNSEAISSGEQSVAASFGYGSRGAAGEDGVLVLAFHDGSRRRIAVAYVGEDIKPNTVYRCDDGSFIEDE
jgi:hypothetical protein